MLGVFGGSELGVNPPSLGAVLVDQSYVMLLHCLPFRIFLLLGEIFILILIRILSIDGVDSAGLTQDQVWHVSLP